MSKKNKTFFGAAALFTTDKKQKENKWKELLSILSESKVYRIWVALKPFNQVWNNGQNGRLSVFAYISFFL